MSATKLPFKPQLHVASQSELSDSMSPSSIVPLRFTNAKDGEWVPVVSCEVAFSVHEVRHLAVSPMILDYLY